MSDDILTAVAWRDFCLWAYDRQDMRGEFELATGKAFMPAPKNALEAAIDSVTGADKSIMHDFIEWVTVTYWGIEDAPESYRKHLARAADAGQGKERE